MTDAELFQAVTKDLHDRGLLARVHVIKAGSVEVHVLPADERRRADADTKVDEQRREDILFASAGN